MTNKAARELRAHSKQFDGYNVVVGNELVKVGPLFRRLLSAALKEERERCIALYHDWEQRPCSHVDVTFPEALRKNMQWRPVKAINRLQKRCSSCGEPTRQLNSNGECIACVGSHL